MTISISPTLFRSFLYRGGLVPYPKPLKVTIGLTNYCNVRCKSCAVWNIYEKDPERATDEMTLDQYQNLFEDLQGISYIEFTGGETFMREDIVEIFSTAANRISSLKICSVTTNGLLASVILQRVRSMMASLPSRVRLNIGVSIDGIPEVHFSQRRIPESFDRAMETFLGLREMAKEFKNLEPHIAYTISTYNGGQLSKFKEYLDNLDIRFEEVTIVYQHSGFLYRTSKAHIQNKEHVMSDVNFAIDNRNLIINKGLFHLVKSHFYKYYLARLKQYISSPKKMIIPCAALTLSAYIDPYGDIYPCVIWSKQIGNIKESSFQTIYRSMIAEQVRKEVANEKCPNCWTPCEAQPSYLMKLPRILFGS